MVDYGGEEIVIITAKQEGINFNLRDIFSEEENGDPINDAIYHRNQMINEKYNVEITPYEVPQNMISTYLQKAVLAGDNTYSAVLPTIGDAFANVIKGLIVDLNSVNNIDPTQPWWNTTIWNDTQLSGKNHFWVGDINLLSFYRMGVMMFTKDLVDKYDIVSPYETVKSGKWTLDTFLSNCRSVYSDLNGNSEYDKDDQYGFTCNAYASDCFAFCANITYVSRSNDNKIELMLDKEKFIPYFTRVIEAINDDNITLYSDKPRYIAERQTIPLNAFTEGRVLYYIEIMAFMTQTHSMELDFGLIPFPKYDENQDDYKNFIHITSSSAVVIPKTVEDIEKIGGILEDMAYYLYKLVRPAYYFYTIEGNYIRDDESYEMLDYILKNTRCDFAHLLRNSGLSLIQNFRTLINNNDTAITSKLATNEESYISVINNINKTISEQ